MATKNAINSNIPIEVSKGGTGISSTTAGQVLLSTSNNVIASSANITSTVAGIVSTPNQSGCSAYLDNTQLNKTGDNTTYDVVFNIQDYDLQNEYDTGSGVFTADATGLYLVVSLVTVSNLSSNHTIGNMQIIKNGSAISVPKSNPWNTAASDNRLTFHVSKIISLTAADTIAIAVQISGGTKTVSVLGADYFTYLQISKIA